MQTSEFLHRILISAARCASLSHNHTSSTMKRSGVVLALILLLCLVVTSRSHGKGHVATDDSINFNTDDCDRDDCTTKGGTEDDSTDDHTDDSMNDDGPDDEGVEDEDTNDESVSEESTDFPKKNLGSIVFLDNKKDDGTIFDDEEAPEGTISRLMGMVPTDNPRNFEAAYDPVFDAYCFNEDYPVPELDPSEQYHLYRQYKKAFDLIKKPTSDVSEDGVTFDRIPGMFLRMCFHDNTIVTNQPDFRDYVASAIDSKTRRWISETRYMNTSGADASNLICPEERFHPNNNLDQTASRVLKSIQTKLKNKYPHFSYADILHNGCNAATIYLTDKNPEKELRRNPFTFGRKDACHVDMKNATKYALCGPSEILPGVDLSAEESTEWFSSRGMSPCLFMGLMWTHTTVAIMGSLCPLTRLTCTTDSEDVSTFPDPTLLYFSADDDLDYFDFFLTRGNHKTLRDPDDEDDFICKWVVDDEEVPWPMTPIDCTLGLSNVKKAGPKALARVIRNFAHDHDYNRRDILQCALNVLGGEGGGTECGSCDKVIPKECKPDPDHKFGGFYSSSHWRVVGN